ncbi:MAG: 2OG-Fe(II) oxygenase [Acidobacteria bacterium]|nr:2OG-Fe(II) oxygenase [Acidobacteriota bacterium]
MKYIEIEYNRELKPLEAVLSGVKYPGDFFVSAAVEIPMPKVEVAGVGTLSFPIPDTQIASLVRRADRAPYGRGEETIVDTSVRSVWQIPPGKVKISGKSWAANFENILSKVTAGLGCDDASVFAELYKLLVYDSGGFFLAHRDTEKTDGMFGTLVLTLPSMYRGGAIRIRHADREVTVETGAADPSVLFCVAFYADCEHEALPVREGNRVCLVYNLVQKRSKGRHRILKAPEYEFQITETAAILDSLQAPSAPAKIAWLLDHQYSPAGLSFSGLKGADAARARVLLQAAARAQCVAHLGIVHIGESGGAETDEDLYYRSRRHRYRSYQPEDDEEDEEEDEDDNGEDISFTPVSVDDTWQYVDGWRDTEDRAVKFGRVPLAAGELLPDGALDGEAPDEKRLTEASGNEGATYERSYHRAALVIWRRDRTADVLLQAGVVVALPYVRRLAAGGKRARPEAIAVAERILDAWPADAHRWDSFSFSIGRASPGPSERMEMIDVLVRLNAPALLERFLRGPVTSSYDGSENTTLFASVSLLEDACAASVLSALVLARMAARTNECAGLLLMLANDPSPSFQEVAEAAVAGLDGIGIRDERSEARGWEWREKHPLVPQFIENLLRGLQRFAGGMLCGTAAEKIASRPGIFSPVTLVVPAIERICLGRKKVTAAVDSAVQRLWTGAAEFLLARSEVPPAPPSDWRLDVELSCSCPDCRELQAFARNPAEHVHRFRVRQDRRRHLHRVIEGHHLDMTHVTDRVGSPQTLVCTKDRRTFHRRVKQYQDEIAAMQTLVKLAHKSGSAALAARMDAAVKLAADLK